VRWIPFLLGPIFRRQGWNDSPFNLYPAKGAYMWRDMERECGRHGIPFRRPSQFPRNGLSAARIAASAADEAWMPAFVRAVYLANFADDRDIASAAVLGELLGAAGCPDPAERLALAETPEIKQRLRDHTDRAIALGVFGAPTFRVEGELFWGSDRMDQAIELAARGTAP
jgi:2-hydroxychromene-2-carboxylate isomerase